MRKTAEIPEAFRINKQIQFDGNQWDLFAIRLGVPFGISTKLKKEGSAYDSTIWLDWRNILHKPQNARINILVDLIIFPDKDFHRSWTDSFSRTADVLEGIRLCDSLMRERRDKYINTEVEEMLSEGCLPRPDVVFIDSDRPGLDIFFEHAGFQRGSQYAGAYRIPWVKLVQMAQDKNLPLF
jgi:hypothetical protein